MEECGHKYNPRVFEAKVIEDDDQADDASFQPPDPVDQEIEQVATTQGLEGDTMMQSNLHEVQTLDFSDTIHVIPPDYDDDDGTETIQPKDELIRWHCRLNHLPYSRMRSMMKCGLLPRRLLDVKEPLCVARQYGKLHRRPWRDKGKEPSNTIIATTPGQIVLVNQMESTANGFIAQLKGKLTTKRYKYAAVFVDQYSKLSYIFL